MAIKRIHSFHVPVMGTAFTIDTPIKVARFGISSVMSIGDDELCENMRKYYSELHHKPYEPIKKWDTDYRARRITAYLDLVHDIVEEQVKTIKTLPFEPGNELTKYFELLADSSPLKKQYLQFLSTTDATLKATLDSKLRDAIQAGSLDVNIMTKLDRSNRDREGNPLPDHDSDASAALRGFAMSKLHSSIVFSAGFNRRLYAYIEQFRDFFPDALGYITKKIILKVSDVRSSLTQGKFLAKKGIWVSEHRIESGLNCGGHAFASDGFLLGPILEEFRQKRSELLQTFMEICNEALDKKMLPKFKDAPAMDITVQGGIGTASENQFLMDHYDVQGTGWATPFLLVPEVTTLDYPTRQKLATAQKEDLYLSEVSPLGVPFNTLRGTDSEEQKFERVEAGKPGSPCPKGHLVSNMEFTKVPICTAASTYEKRKLKELDASGLDAKTYKTRFDFVVGKSCLCEDLAAGALIAYGIDNKRPLKSAVCPGPNLAYFSKISTLAEMTGHIYGRLNLLNDTYRPNFFISELKMYIDYLAKEIKKTLPSPTPKQVEYFLFFKQNLNDGIAYYKELIPKLKNESEKYRETMKTELLDLKQELDILFSTPVLNAI